MLHPFHLNFAFVLGVRHFGCLAFVSRYLNTYLANDYFYLEGYLLIFSYTQWFINSNLSVKEISMVCICENMKKTQILKLFIKAL